MIGGNRAGAMKGILSLKLTQDARSQVTVQSQQLEMLALKRFLINYTSIDYLKSNKRYQL